MFATGADMRRRPSLSIRWKRTCRRIHVSPRFGAVSFDKLATQTRDRAVTLHTFTPQTQGPLDPEDSRT